MTYEHLDKEIDNFNMKYAYLMMGMSFIAFLILGLIVEMIFNLKGLKSRAKVKKEHDYSISGDLDETEFERTSQKNKA